ncbi:MAG: hypothetical protein ACWGMZ_10500 [Thermoguttaceae bacterium]
MTKLLAEAFQRASELPENLQDELACELIEEIEWEDRWDKTLAESQDKIDQLAQKAIEEFKAGKTREMGFDEL